MNRHKAGSLATIACLALQGCEHETGKGPYRFLRTETASYCANTHDAQVQYLVTISAGGAPGLNMRGSAGVFVDRTRSYDTDPLSVTVFCPEYNASILPHPADRREPVLSIPLESTLPVEFTCELSFVAPSDYEGSECMPWHMEGWGELDGIARDHREAFLELDASETAFPARRK